MIQYKITTDADKTAAYFDGLARMTPLRVNSNVLNQARVLQGLIKSLAPVKTGALRNSFIISEFVATNVYAHAEISSDLDYAYIVEYGSSTRKPNMYFRPAVNQFEPAFRANLASILFKD